MIDKLIGHNFFFADHETGIGWESHILDIYRQPHEDGYLFELSCGTRVNISHSDYMKNGYKVFFTNLKEDNDKETK